MRPVAPDVFLPVPWIRARQRAEGEQPRHEPKIGLRFAGLDELIDLLQCGEVVPRLGRGGRQGSTAGQFDRPGHVAEGNKSVSFLLVVFAHRSSRCDHRPSGQRRALGRPPRGGTSPPSLRPRRAGVDLLYLDTAPHSDSAALKVA